ncbi:unnamed protein product, partial [Ilex paraguariensis]
RRSKGHGESSSASVSKLTTNSKVQHRRVAPQNVPPKSNGPHFVLPSGRLLPGVAPFMYRGQPCTTLSSLRVATPNHTHANGGENISNTYLYDT